jgi:HK97 family phage portal protein
MGKIARFLGIEKRTGGNYQDAYTGAFREARGLGQGGATPDAVLSALSVATRCVALRAELMASVPLHVYRRTNDGGRERAEDHSLVDVLAHSPNPYMTGFEFREFLVRSHDLYGNAYARIERNARGEIVALHPFFPTMVAIERLPSGRLRFRATDMNGVVWVLLQEEMLHLRGPTRNGIYGQSPLEIARASLGAAMTHAVTVESISANRLAPSGVLSVDGKMLKEDQQQLRSLIKEKFMGAANAGKLLVVNGEMKFSQVAMTPADAQFIETRKLSNEDVARIFGMPPTTVGLTDKATYNNVENEARAMVQNAIAPLAARVEAALARCLLTPVGRSKYYFEHDLNALTRGDMKSRFDSYRIAREIGAFSANDVRQRENEPPIANGDEYHMPANWVPLGTKAPESKPVNPSID